MVGSLVAGLLLGVAEALCSYLLNSGLTLVVAYFLFLVVLLVRPRGLLGTPLEMRSLVFCHRSSLAVLLAAGSPAAAVVASRIMASP